MIADIKKTTEQKMQKVAGCIEERTWARCAPGAPTPVCWIT